MKSKLLLTFALAVAAALTACGGGSDLPTPPLSSNVTAAGSYTHVSLVQSPIDVRSVFIAGGAGSLTFSDDDVAYPVAVSAAMTDASSYAVSGDLSQTGLMLCKPASKLPGYRSGVGHKTAHFILPGDAVPATATDLQGRVLDLYENCSADPKGSITFHADGTATAGSETSSAAALAEYFSSSGSSEEDATYYGRIYKLGTTLFIVERAVPKAGATGEIDGVAVRNEHGYLAVYRSRP